MTRNILDKRLKSLTSELAEMGSLVEKQIYEMERNSFEMAQGTGIRRRPLPLPRPCRIVRGELRANLELTLKKLT